ncbi:WD-repeats-region domain-containing protein [Favolaschia claudopus]|uniref:WD-repeats-region domain-containing protein n=1 Tax=Favolaschia claudopus TaxID=2862362 RepID=A0AAW0BFD9_9AGAR
MDVDAFAADEEERQKKLKEPIVISDDEDSSDAEIKEVEVKLEPRSRTRSNSTPDDVQITGHVKASPEVVNLVSDEEDEKPPSTIMVPVAGPSRRSKRRGATASAVASSSRSSAFFRTPEAKTSGTSMKASRDTPTIIKKDSPPPSKPATPSKRAKRAKKLKFWTEVDSDEEYLGSIIDPYADMTMNDEPMPPTQNLQQELAPVVEALPQRKRKFVNISTGPPLVPIKTTDYYVWDFLREYKILRHPRRRPKFLDNKRPRLQDALAMEYVLSHRFRRAAGCINSILQHDGRVVVCSNTVGGDAGAELDPYNKPGTLISWCRNDPDKVLYLEGDETNLFAKHYCVHSIAYDPVSNTLASSGADNYVRTWTFDATDDAEPYAPPETRQFRVGSRYATPHDVAFNPARRKLSIQDIANAKGTSATLSLTQRRQDAYSVGAIAWGCGPSSDLILALSESLHVDVHNGFHHAFDVEQRKSVCQFDASEDGDALCIDPTGEQAALVTNDGTDSFLRIYDLRTKSSVATQEIKLLPFNSEGHEVNSMMFSPDSIYLALGRDDNCAHIYDSRMLNRRGRLQDGPLCNFKHDNMPFSSKEQNFFGVVGVQWVERGGRLGLVTGGNDGCVRLWDPSYGNDKGTVLAQADSDVAYFTLGDRFKGEHELIVGDSDGAVYVMDRFSTTEIWP